MTRKNGRWASYVAIIIVILYFGSLKFASAHLSLSSLSDVNKGVVSQATSPLPLTPITLSSDIKSQQLLPQIFSKSSVQTLPASEDYGLSYLEQSSSVLTSYDTLPSEGGVYVSASASIATMTNFLSFLSNFDLFKKNIFDTTKKVIVTNTNTAENLADTFKSWKTGKQYLMKINQLSTVMSADGFFAVMGSTGLISIAETENNNKLFSVLVHEMIHAVQFNNNQYTSSRSYNFMKEDATKFQTSDLKSSLVWVQSELEAHMSTASFINAMLTLPDKTKNILLTQLGLNAQSLENERDSELMKYSWYKNEEQKIINELLSREAPIILESAPSRDMLK